jgi:RHS repeat-associated protein
MDTFGVALSATGTTPNPYRYGAAWGYITDPSGLLQLGHRFYWPEVGRFLSQDPEKDWTNWYSYANGNPLRSIDPDGLRPCPDPDACNDCYEDYEDSVTDCYVDAGSAHAVIAAGAITAVCTGAGAPAGGIGYVIGAGGTEFWLHVICLPRARRELNKCLTRNKCQ